MTEHVTDPETIRNLLDSDAVDVPWQPEEATPDLRTPEASRIAAAALIGAAALTDDDTVAGWLHALAQDFENDAKELDQ